MPRTITESVPVRDVKMNEVALKSDGTPFARLVERSQKVKFLYLTWADVTTGTTWQDRYEPDSVATITVAREKATVGDLRDAYREAMEAALLSDEASEEQALAKFQKDLANSGTEYALNGHVEALTAAANRTRRVREIRHCAQDNPTPLHQIVVAVADEATSRIINSGLDDTWSGRVRNELARVRFDETREWLRGAYGNALAYARRLVALDAYDADTLATDVK